jgi:hypothetical protein
VKNDTFTTQQAEEKGLHEAVMSACVQSSTTNMPFDDTLRTYPWTCVAEKCGTKGGKCETRVRGVTCVARVRGVAWSGSSGVNEDLDPAAVTCAYADVAFYHMDAG